MTAILDTAACILALIATLLYYVFIGPDEPGDDSQYEYEHCPSGWSGAWVKVERKEVEYE